jgi:hypothetical protein
LENGEYCLRNPLREICTVGSVRGETSVGHGGPKRARSRKRWTEAKGSLQLTESPLLGERLSRRRPRVRVPSLPPILIRDGVKTLHLIAVTQYSTNVDSTIYCLTAVKTVAPPVKASPTMTVMVFPSPGVTMNRLVVIVLPSRLSVSINVSLPRRNVETELIPGSPL